jgi:hypothetical protein
MTEDGNVSDLTIEILQGIRAELVALRQDMNTGLSAVRTELRAELRSGLGEVRTELGEVRTELGEVRAQLHTLAESTEAGFQAVLAQGDRRFVDHEGRIRRLEANAGFEPRRR